MAIAMACVQYRWGVYKNIRAHIDNAEGGMDAFTQAYKHFGINRGEHEGKKGIWYREWAPGAQAVALIGEFNNWEPKDDHWAVKSEYGTFALFLPDVNGQPQIPHKCAQRPFSEPLRSLVFCRSEAAFLVVKCLDGS